MWLVSRPRSRYTFIHPSGRLPDRGVMCSCSLSAVRSSFKRLCIFGPKGAVQIRYYYYYYIYIFIHHNMIERTEQKVHYYFILPNLWTKPNSTPETLTTHPHAAVHWNAAIIKLVRAVDHFFLPLKIHDDISNGWRVVMSTNAHIMVKKVWE